MFIQSIFEEIRNTRPLTTDSFSTEWLGQNPSYYRSMKSREMRPSNQVLMNLMEQLRKQSVLLREGKHKVLLDVAAKYDVLADRCAKEIATRSLATTHSKWVREKILAAVEEINQSRWEKSILPIIVL